MKTAIRFGQGLAVLAMIWSVTGCIVAQPREGYYDQPHHRYYHERGWHECTADARWCR